MSWKGAVWVAGYRQAVPYFVRVIFARWVVMRFVLTHNS